MDVNFYWSESSIGVYGTVELAAENSSECTPLLNDAHLSDGRIPVVLGMGTGVFMVISMFHWHYLL